MNHTEFIIKEDHSDIDSNDAGNLNFGENIENLKLKVISSDSDDLRKEVAVAGRTLVRFRYELFMRSFAGIYYDPVRGEFREEGLFW
jgi:hypothetical protein